MRLRRNGLGVRRELRRECRSATRKNNLFPHRPRASQNSGGQFGYEGWSIGDAPKALVCKGKYFELKLDSLDMGIVTAVDACSDIVGAWEIAVDHNKKELVPRTFVIVSPKQLTLPAGGVHTYS